MLYRPEPCRYYLNALFDLELGGYPVDAVKRSAAEMTTLFLPLLQPGDAIILDADPPDNHAAHLRSCGFLTPDKPGASATNLAEMVWGWNREAAIRTGSKTDGVAVPPLDVVRDVNGRRFCSELGLKEGFGVPGSCFCDTRESFDAAEVTLRGSYPLVIKPAFGGAGFGLRIVRSPDLPAPEQRLIDTYLQHGGFVLEPWCERITDLSTSIEIGRDGSLAPVVFQRPWVNRYGAFYGMYCAAADPFIDRCRTELERCSVLLARAAAVRGYFGPIGIDHFTYQDQRGDVRLAACIEINARFTMGMLAQAYRQRVAPNHHTLLRFIGKKKCRLPESMDEWSHNIGKGIVFDMETRCGVIPISPMRMRYEGKWQQPQRSAFFVAGTSMEQLEHLDRAVRSRFLPAGSTG